MEKWTIQDSIDCYNINNWGKDYFSINENGHVSVHPDKRPDQAIDLKELVDQLQRRGIDLPILLRFTDILRHRVGEIQKAFKTAIQEYEYQGQYTCVYPIKVNQQRHVVEEIKRVSRASECLLHDDASGFGKLMFEGHQSLRDLYEVSCPELDALVEIADGLPGCLGARLTGAGFGGCTVNLVEAERADDLINRLKEGYSKKMQRSAEVYLCQASRGAYTEELPI